MISKSISEHMHITKQTINKTKGKTKKNLLSSLEVKASNKHLKALRHDILSFFFFFLGGGGGSLKIVGN